MATDSILNIEELLAPISEDAAQGTDLRQDESPDSLYYALKDARNNARAIERNSFPGDDNEEHLERDHWKLILKEAPKVLKEQAKDLEVAAWLTEALIREHGFSGLRDGLQLINGLVQHHWDGLYPLPDEDGISTRVAVLAGLNGVNNSNGTLVAPINTAAITKDGEYSSWSLSQAKELDKITDPAAKKKKMDSGVVSVDTIKAAVKPSASEFYLDLQDDINTALTEFEQLDSTLTKNCGDDAPPGANIRKSLEKSLSALNVIAKDILMPPEDIEVIEEAEGEPAEQAAPGDEGAASVKASGNIKGRLEAFKQLQGVADFFKRTEPHSPIGYTLERVVRWGDMALPELLQELVPDPQAKDYYEKLVGILPPPPAPMQPGMDPNMMHQPGMDPMAGQYNDGMGGQSPMDPGMGGDFNQQSGYDNPLFK